MTNTCDSRTKNISNTWKLVWNSESQAPPWKLSAESRDFKKIPRWFLLTLKFERYCHCLPTSRCEVINSCCNLVGYITVASLFLPNGKLTCLELNPKTRNSITYQKEQIKHLFFISLLTRDAECQSTEQRVLKLGKKLSTEQTETLPWLLNN